MNKIILIDYENIQNINFNKITENDFIIYVFIGESQNKIPFKTVKETQKYGDLLKWIKIDGNGPNALDFHIAYYLGKMTNSNIENEYIILSKDKGFDPLIKYIEKQKIKIKRINSIMEITNKNEKNYPDTNYDKVIENIEKIDKNKRPRKQNTLRKHIKTVIGKNVSEEDIDDIIDQLFMKKIVSEENGKLKYE